MSSKSIKLVLKKNKKLDKIYHPETSLVFKSATEKIVIGRIEDDEFVPLDQLCVDLCLQNNFKYDVECNNKVLNSHKNNKIANIDEKIVSYNSINSKELIRE